MITEKRREYNKLYHRKYSKLPKNKAYATNYQLVRYYGMTIADYRVLFEAQDGRCAICSRHQSVLTCKLSVDHSHKTQKIRGLLCQHCNATILGVVENYSDLIPRAKEYLRRFKCLISQNR